MTREPDNTAMFNPDDYREDWKDHDMSEEQLNELLRVLWDIAKTFVIMGYEGDISQILLAMSNENSSRDSGKLIKIDNPEKFNCCAQNDAEESESQ